MRTGIDTNVISSLWSRGPLTARITQLLDDALGEGGLVICAPVYVELCGHPKMKMNGIDQFLRDTSIEADFALDEAIWREAAAAFAAYADRRRKSRGGEPKRMIADFVIGSHAMLQADRLFTFDSSRYRHAFPRLRLFP